MKTDSRKYPKRSVNKELTEARRASLAEGKTVKTGELLDKKGKPYAGYITLNRETGKTDFIFPKEYKEALAAGKVIPDDRYKTQVAVNSEGKTTEATKNLKEPLEKGQSQPTEKQAEKQDTKKKGRKVSMTGNWENALAQIERGAMKPESFRKAIEDCTRQITAELLDVAVSPLFWRGTGGGSLPEMQICQCPLFPKSCQMHRRKLRLGDFPHHQ